MQCKQTYNTVLMMTTNHHHAWLPAISLTSPQHQTRTEQVLHLIAQSSHWSLRPAQTRTKATRQSLITTDCPVLWRPSMYSTCIYVGICVTSIGGRKGSVKRIPPKFCKLGRRIQIWIYRKKWYKSATYTAPVRKWHRALVTAVGYSLECMFNDANMSKAY